MEPFKNNFNPQMVAEMAAHFTRVDQAFPQAAFIETATGNFDLLELKQRSNQICAALLKHMPSDFRTACNLMIDALHPAGDADLDIVGNTMNADGIRGWGIMPMCEFVAQRGQGDFDHGMQVLAELTKRFSAEFSIRHFIAADPTRAMTICLEWCDSPNMHVRRLASEGSRPKLPWGLQLKTFVADPSPLIPLLEKLKDDPEEYVRRSVANNLNDIAKDHPDAVADLAAKWMVNANKDRVRMVKHACRTLIKQGHEATLKALGYGPASVKDVQLNIKTPEVVLGGKLEFELTLSSDAQVPQPLIIDFIIHHRKANGETSPKVFKWKTMDIKAGEQITLSKKHQMKPITTRVYYEGGHGLGIQINGQSFVRDEFMLHKK